MTRKKICLLVCFDALSDHIKIQCSRKSQYRPDNTIATFIAKISDEGLINF